MRSFAFRDGGARVELRLRVGSFGRDGVGWKVWPSAELLAAWLMEHKACICGLDVLEVGAGPGLVGLTAAQLGARMVVLSDCSHHVLALLRDNVERNCLPGRTSIDVVELDFEEDAGEDRSFDVVLASDVIYARGAAAALPRFLARALKPGGRFYTCCPSGRGDGGVDVFLAGMSESGFECIAHEPARGGPSDQSCKFLFFQKSP